MRREDLPQFLQNTYEADRKADKLEIIQAFEDCGCKLSSNLHAMLHCGAPTYPKELRFVGYDANWDEVRDFNYRPHWHRGRWNNNIYTMRRQLEQNPGVYVQKISPVVMSKDVFDLL